VSKRLSLGGLIFCVAVSVVMLVLAPVPGGRHYEYAVLMAVALTAIVGLYQASPRAFFGKRALVSILACGIILGLVNFVVLKPDSEIVRTYGTVFEALENGRNPYTSGTIYHEIEGLGPAYGNFNYPPVEILPYYLVYRIAGGWNITVLTAAMIVIQALPVLVLFLMFPRLPPLHLLAFVPMLLVGEIKTSAAMTLLATALILWVIKKDREAPHPVHGAVIAVLFGLGLMTKFLILPLMAAYYAHQFDRKDLRSLAGIAVDVGIAIGTAVLVMAPFGVVNVLRNTLVFNVVLEDRAVLTTFYPNVLSGPLTWAGLGGVYPIMAGALLLAAVLAAPRMSLFTAMLTSACVFMVVASTPEPQFLPAILLLVVAAKGMAVEGLDPAPAARSEPALDAIGERRGAPVV